MHSKKSKKNYSGTARPIAYQLQETMIKTGIFLHKCAVVICGKLEAV